MITLPMLILRTTDRVVCVRHVRRGTFAVECDGARRTVSSSTAAGAAAREALGIVARADRAVVVHAE